MVCVKQIYPGRILYEMDNPYGLAEYPYKVGKVRESGKKVRVYHY